MKEPKVLNGFKDISGKRIFYIEELSHKDEYVYIATEDKELLVFYSDAEYHEQGECCESTIEFYDFNNVKYKIISSEEVRNALLKNEVIDKEYIDMVLNEYYKPIKEMIYREVIGAILVSERPIEPIRFKHDITLYDSDYKVIISSGIVEVNEEDNTISLLANGRFKNAKYYHAHQY